MYRGLSLYKSVKLDIKTVFRCRGSNLKNRYNKDSVILDVGAGEGTYYKLLGDYFRDIDAIEIYRPNIEKYKLKN